MQRWMLWAAAGVVGLVLLAGGAYFARKEYYASKQQPIWVPLALRADISMEDQSKLAKEIESRLRDKELLRNVVVDAGLQEKFGTPSEDAAVKELEARLFVKVGSADTPTGSVPSINIGFNGTGKEKEATSAAAMRIIKDVWVLLGIDPVSGKPLGQSAPEPPGSY